MSKLFNEWAPKYMGLLIKDFSLSTEDAAAIVGNAGHESNGFQNLQEIKPVVPGSRGGYGIMQWTGPRRREYEAYCKRNSLDPADMESNYKFLFVELSGPEGKVLPKLKAAGTLEQKTRVFSEVFLRPGIPHLDSRVIWAKRALALLPPTSSPSATPEAPKAPVKKTLIDILIEIIKVIFGSSRSRGL